MYEGMYVCLYVCLYVCMYLGIVCMNAGGSYLSSFLRLMLSGHYLGEKKQVSIRVIFSS